MKTHSSLAIVLLGLAALASSHAQQITCNASNSWAGGFEGVITIRNNTATTLNNWRLKFRSDRNLTSIWNAAVESRTGTAYVVAPASWNASIAPGASVDVGFVASPPPATNAFTDFSVTSAASPPLRRQFPCRPW